jgi:uncharacterized protein (UPF0264 family)
MTPFARPRPGLLVSVRSPEEAAVALTGGAQLIDVKEPANGSLGRADDQTISSVLECVASRRPVSAALGELADYGATQYAATQELPFFRDPRLTFVKWGLAGCGQRREEEIDEATEYQKSPRYFNAHALHLTAHSSWQTRLGDEIGRPGQPQTVHVAYADWQCARAPRVHEVAAFACRKAGNVLLIDTHCKESASLRTGAWRHRPTLLDWLAPEEISALCGQCHAAGVRIALAGSLGFAEIEQLRCAQPDWFAVRGAVCDNHDRQGSIDADKVRRLVKLLERAD